MPVMMLNLDNMCVLEVLSPPLEDKIASISQAHGSLTFPTNFQLVDL